MPISKINTFGIADNAVISSKIAQDIVLAEDIGTNQVTINELAPNAVTSAKIVDGTIITTDLANDAVETIKIKDLNVTTAKIADNAITVDKIGDNAVTLGTHTTGNYMSNVTAGSGISITHTQGEGSSAAIAIDSSTGFLVSNDSVTLGTHTTGQYVGNINTVSSGGTTHPIGIGTATQYSGDRQNYTLSLDMTADFNFQSEVKARSYVDNHQQGSLTPGTNDFTLNLALANSFKINLSVDSDIIFSNIPTSPGDTMIWTLTIQQIASGAAKSVVYPTTVHWPGGLKPTLSATNGAIDQFVFMKTGSSSNIYGFTVGQDIKAPSSP